MRSKTRLEHDPVRLVQELRVHQIELEIQNQQLLETQRELEASRNRYQALFDGAPFGYVAVDDDSRIVEANRTAANQLHIAVPELLGLPLVALMDEADADRFFLRLRAAAQLGATQVCDVSLRCADGRVIEGRLEIAPDPNGIAGRTQLVMIRDVTRQRELEDELRHAQKMEAVGELAGGVAHNLGNVLQAILVSVRLAQEVADDQRRARALERAATSTRKGAALITQLMTFARKQEGKLDTRPVPLDAWLRDATALVKPLLGDMIILDVEPAALASVVIADPVQLEQILRNLAANARDAMPEGGTLAIRSRSVMIDAPTAEAHGARPGAYAVITIHDTGAGMDAKTKARIFEPFFTTKGIGEGTGLGLSTAFAVVRQFGGWIEVESERSLGTTFSIFLPSLPVLAAERDAAPSAS